MRIIFATRPSTLARLQTRHVISLLKAAHPGLQCGELIIVTEGDHTPDRPLQASGGKGLFIRPLEKAMLSGEAQAVVHSLKDLPLEEAPGLILGAILEREEPFDVMVSANGTILENMPNGARVGTSSLRRAAQLLAIRPDLQILPLGGNVDTRITKMREGEYDAVILAYAVLLRLGLADSITETFPLSVMLPAPGQGALAVQCRADDLETRELLAAVHHQPTATAVTAERAFLAGLGGDCSLPVAAFAENNNGPIILTGAVISADGKHSIRLSAADEDPGRLGTRLAELVRERGAANLLKASA